MAQAIDELNKIKNPRLTIGRAKATGWRWTGDSDTTAWSREMAQNGDAPVMTIRSHGAAGWAAWARRVPCKPNEHYRLEVVVSCDCQPADDR